MLRKLVRDLPLVLYIFYVIYTPAPDTNVLTSKFVVLTVLAGVLLIPYVLSGDRGVWNLLSRPAVMILMVATFAGSIYLMFVRVASGEPVESLIDLRIVQNNVLNLMIVNVAIIVDQLKKRGYSKRQSFEVLLWLGSFQGIFSIAGLFIPWVRNISYTLYQASGSDNIFVMQSRIFGLTGDFTYGTPIYHGVLAGVAFYYLVKSRTNYLVHIVLIMSVAAMNGRTGLVVFVVMAIFTIVGTYGKRGNLLGMGAALLALVAAGAAAMSFLGDISPATHRFVMSFLDDTRRLLFEGEATGNYGALFEGFARAPDGFGLLFGTGERVYDGEPGFNSDIGFTNDLYAGGLTYVLFVYLVFLAFLIRNSRGHALLSLELVLVFFLANFKGEVFRSSVILFIFLFIKLVSSREDVEPETSTGKIGRQYARR